MFLKKRSCFLGFAVLSMSLLTSCGPALFVGGAATGAVVASRDGTIGEQVDDLEIWLSVYHALRSNKAGSSDLTAVNVQVKGARVVLSGSVENLKDKFLASSIAKSVKGVASVSNDIRIGESSLGDKVSDFVLTNRARSALVIEVGLRASNYHINSDQGVITVSGTALNERERDSVISMLRRLKGVSKVNSHITIVDGKAGGRAPSLSPAAHQNLKEKVHSAMVFAVGERAETFEVEVTNNGFVLIRGIANDLGEASIVKRAVSGVSGVSSIDDRMKLAHEQGPYFQNPVNNSVVSERQTLDPELLASDVKFALHSTLGGAASRYYISADNKGVVVITGTALSGVERRQMIKAASGVAGVKKVETQVKIAS